eukprot:4152262-Prymnesium_polylepis.1
MAQTPAFVACRCDRKSHPSSPDLCASRHEFTRVTRRVRWKPGEGAAGALRVARGQRRAQLLHHRRALRHDRRRAHRPTLLLRHDERGAHRRALRCGNSNLESRRGGGGSEHQQEARRHFCFYSVSSL